MDLIIKRDQRQGTFGKVVFQLEVKAKITPEERKAIEQYGLANTLLWQAKEIIDPGKGLLGLATRALHHATNVTVTVGSLVTGKAIECKDVVELLAVEEQIKEAAKLFKAVLNAAAHFGGEEVVTL